VFYVLFCIICGRVERRSALCSCLKGKYSFCQSRCVSRTKREPSKGASGQVWKGKNKIIFVYFHQKTTFVDYVKEAPQLCHVTTHFLPKRGKCAISCHFRLFALTSIIWPLILNIILILIYFWLFYIINMNHQSSYNTQLWVCLYVCPFLLFLQNQFPCPFKNIEDQTLL
jgi:hypothetical protein